MANDTLGRRTQTWRWLRAIIHAARSTGYLRLRWTWETPPDVDKAGVRQLEGDQLEPVWKGRGGRVGTVLGLFRPQSVLLGTARARGMRVNHPHVLLDRYVEKRRLDVKMAGVYTYWSNNYIRGNVVVMSVSNVPVGAMCHHIIVHRLLKSMFPRDSECWRRAESRSFRGRWGKAQRVYEAEPVMSEQGSIMRRNILVDDLFYSARYWRACSSAARERGARPLIFPKKPTLWRHVPLQYVQHQWKPVQFTLKGLLSFVRHQTYPADVLQHQMCPDFSFDIVRFPGQTWYVE